MEDSCGTQSIIMRCCCMYCFMGVHTGQVLLWHICGA